MLKIRPSNERGRADHGWLKSRHSFSFAGYHDPEHLGFRSLRVLNQDVVAPGGGFPTHPHQDMEIFSYVLDGTLEHRDSLGNGRQLRPGQIQLMSAGTGVRHSEFNPSATDPLHFLQIWILPKERGLTPGYTEWHPKDGPDGDAMVLVISEDGRDGSATIHQDVSVFRVRLDAGASAEHHIAPGRAVWLQVIGGSADVNGTAVAAGDAVSSEEAGPVVLTAGSAFEALLFDLR